MNYPLVIGLSSIAGVVLLFVWLYRGGKKIVAEQKPLIAASRPGWRKVIEVSALGIVRNVTKDPMVKILMQVAPDSGATYAATTAWYLDSIAIHGVQPGLDVPVLIDVQDASVIYPAEPWLNTWSMGKMALRLRK